MVKEPIKKKKRPLIMLWGRLMAVVQDLATFLGWQKSGQINRRIFFCDVMKIIGLGDAFKICRDAQPDEKEQLALLEYLKERKDQLSPEHLEKLPLLEEFLVNRVFKCLEAASGLNDAPIDSRTKDDTREAIRETIKEGDVEERRALAMISEGDLDGGLELLSNLASASAARNALENGTQWRRIGRLAYGVDTMRALDAYEKVVALDPSDPWDAIYLGRLYKRAGNLHEARLTYERALALLPAIEERDRSVLHDEVGDVQVSQGDLPGALESFRAGMEIAARLASSDPGHADWQRDLSVSHDRIGDVQVSQGDLSGALESFRAGMEIAARLASSDPGHAGWQADLAASYGKMGQLMSRLGDKDEALALFTKGRALVAPLAAQSGHVLWKQYLANFDADIAALGE